MFENASKRKTVITADNNMNYYQYIIIIRDSHLIHFHSYIKKKKLNIT